MEKSVQLFFVLLVLGVSGCLAGSNQPQQTAQVNTDLARCNGLSMVEKNSCIAGIALATKDFELCYRLQDGGMQTIDCMTSVCVELENAGCCEKVDGFEDACIIKIAVKTKNKDLCDFSIPRLDQYCIEQIDRAG